MFDSLIQDSFATSLHLVGSTAFVWAPLILVSVGWYTWLHYIRRFHLSELKWTLLEVKTPKDVFKSPAAMELVLINAFYQTGGMSTWWHRYWLGNVPIFSSLEIVSIEGRVHFFIRIQTKLRPLVESQIYAQYPQAEVTEVHDYTLDVPPHTKDGEWSMFGSEFKKAEVDAMPIKTYIDYGLDKAVGSLDEEQRIDPITSTMEALGSLRDGEQFWIQIVVRASHWARFPKPGAFVEKEKWQKVGKAKVKELKDALLPKKEGEQQLRMTKGETDNLNAIERSLTKFGFDCGIRAIYLARKDRFDPSRIPLITGLLKQYNNPELNSFVPTNITGYDYPWEDFTGKRTVHIKKDMLEAYRHRGYFYQPYNHIHDYYSRKHRPLMVLNSEELATIFHFPGRVSETPTFERIEAKKSEPPVNLPM